LILSSGGDELTEVKVVAMAVKRWRVLSEGGAGDRAGGEV